VTPDVIIEQGGGCEVCERDRSIIGVTGGFSIRRCDLGGRHVFSNEFGSAMYLTRTFFDRLDTRTQELVAIYKEIRVVED
jgi:hypothetical protein